jgi:hypothetical protein
MPPETVAVIVDVPPGGIVGWDTESETDSEIITKLAVYTLLAVVGIVFESVIITFALRGLLDVKYEGTTNVSTLEFEFTPVKSAL